MVGAAWPAHAATGRMGSRVRPGGWSRENEAERRIVRAPVCSPAADAPYVSQTDKVRDWGEWSRQAVAAMTARNQAWISRFDVERAPFRWDLATAELCFERATDQVVADLCLVGTASEGEGTFLWAWANEAIPDSAKRGLDAVRTFGATHDLPRLVTPEWPGGRADGLEMLAIAGRVQDASGGFIDRTGGLLFFFTLHRFRVRPLPGAPGRVAG